MGEICKKCYAIILSEIKQNKTKLGHYSLPSEKKEVIQRHAHLNNIKDDSIRRYYFGRVEMKDKKKTGLREESQFAFLKKLFYTGRNTCHFKNFIIKFVNLRM